MSRNKPVSMPQEQRNTKRKQPKGDPRIRRTRERLGMTLLQLILEKPIEEVTVQEVLDGAAVGRSTFYLHFRDKNDLLLSQLEIFLEAMSTILSVKKERSNRVVPLTEMFDHIGSQKQIYRALRESGKLADFYDLAQDYFTRGIERRLGQMQRLRQFSGAEVRICAIALSGSLLALLRWWMDGGDRESAAKLDELFHCILWEGITARIPAKIR